MLANQAELGEIRPAHCADVFDRIDPARGVIVDPSADLCDHEAIQDWHQPRPLDMEHLRRDGDPEARPMDGLERPSQPSGDPGLFPRSRVQVE
jgi:hypothetical protein